MHKDKSDFLKNLKICKFIILKMQDIFQ